MIENLLQKSGIRNRILKLQNIIFVMKAKFYYMLTSKDKKILFNKRKRKEDHSDNNLSIVSNALSGTTGGALIGATFGIVGSVVGGIVGGIVTGYSGYRTLIKNKNIKHRHLQNDK